ncbi:MAG: 5-formyltetrahydrofolate cyclo-ligase [Candidatus Saccharibacteria bacterium]|nr:5-formyltetrahydrofolate cyclo-ligase [Moraxellaceae bacterium]
MQTRLNNQIHITKQDVLAEQQRLRKSLRRQRLSLSIHIRRRAEQAVVRQMRRQPNFVNAQRVGLYLDAFGEVPTGALIQLCFKLRKAVYLPVVRSVNQPLSWSRITRHQWQNQRMIKHRFGMKQPLMQRGVSVKVLDCLFMPLVGFDLNGYRLGMGGGFYDRTLASCSTTGKEQTKPWRIGIAYDFQRVDSLHSNHWDISLHAIVTQSGYRRFQS